MRRTPHVLEGLPMQPPAILLAASLVAGCSLWVPGYAPCEPGSEGHGYYLDQDGDGFGDDERPLNCSNIDPAKAYAPTGGDCDDLDSQVHPGRSEVCNGLDDDCNGNVDDADDDPGTIEQSGATIWYRDADEDGYGVAEDRKVACQAPDGYGAFEDRYFDCDDSDPSWSLQCPWADVATATDYACGVHSNGSVTCWGAPSNEALLAPPDVAFSTIALADTHACGLLAEDGSLRCWGGGGTPEDAGYSKLDAQGPTICGLAASDGSIRCWNRNGSNPLRGLITPNQSYTDLTVGFAYHNPFVCALDSSGRADCWGGDDNHPVGAPPGDPQLVAIDGGASGDGFACGIRQVDAVPVCWPANGGIYDSSVAPGGVQLDSVVAGALMSWGIRQEDHALVQWGHEVGVLLSTPAATGPFKKVSGSASTISDYACGVREDGTLSCWTVGPQPSATAPGTAWTDAAAGDGYTAAVLDASRLSFTGDSPHPSPPRFSTMAVGNDFLCAVRSENQGGLCWGPGVHGEAVAPKGRTFLQISAGERHSCGVDVNQEVVCWGDCERGECTPPPDHYEEVRAGKEFTCGLNVDRSIDCWGAHERGLDGRYISVAAGASGAVCGLTAGGGLDCVGIGVSGSAHAAMPQTSDWIQVGTSGYLNLACGLHEDGTVSCWGDEEVSMYEASTTSPVYDIPSADRFVAISVGSTDICGLRDDGSVSCWGYGFTRAPPAEAGPFRTISVGLTLACGLNLHDEIECWSGAAEFDPTPTDCSLVTAGKHHVCAACVQGTFCFGDDDAGQSSPTGTEIHVQLAAGDAQTCGLTAEGLVTCWGDDTYGQIDVPARLVATTLTVGGNHTCVLDEDGHPGCWGDLPEWEGPLDPSATYLALATGTDHVCALDLDGHPVCGGDDSHGQLDIPEDIAGMSFVSLAAGGYHTCALDAEGHATCWGLDSHGQVSDAPAWAFESLTAGSEHTCGLKADGILECWGRDLDGESSVPFPWDA